VDTFASRLDKTLKELRTKLEKRALTASASAASTAGKFKPRNPKHESLVHRNSKFLYQPEIRTPTEIRSIVPETRSSSSVHAKLEKRALTASASTTGTFEPRNPKFESSTETLNPLPETRTTKFESVSETQDPVPEARNSKAYPKPETLLPRLCTRNPAPETLYPKSCTHNPVPKTLYPKPCSRNLKPETRNPKPETRRFLLVYLDYRKHIPVKEGPFYSKE